MQKLLKYISEHKVAFLSVNFAMFLLLVIGFVQIADEVFEGETLWLDEAVLKTINGFSSSFLDTLFVVVTQFAGVISIITLTIGLLSFLMLRHKNKKALIVGSTVAGAALLNIILKLIFERARPDLWDQLVVETSFSFPSGHAMISAALALSVIYIFWSTRYRWIAFWAGSLFILVIGFSRLYLGVHYPTDILAGWIVSAAWLCIVIIVVNSKGSLASLSKGKDTSRQSRR